MREVEAPAALPADRPLKESAAHRSDEQMGVEPMRARAACGGQVARCPSLGGGAGCLKEIPKVDKEQVRPANGEECRLQMLSVQEPVEKAQRLSEVARPGGRRHAESKECNEERLEEPQVHRPQGQPGRAESKECKQKRIEELQRLQRQWAAESRHSAAWADYRHGAPWSPVKTKRPAEAGPCVKKKRMEDVRHREREQDSFMKHAQKEREQVQQKFGPHPDSRGVRREAIQGQKARTATVPPASALPEGGGSSQLRKVKQATTAALSRVFKAA